jgi:hypothetical protein
VEAVQLRLSERGLDIFNAVPNDSASTTVTIVDSPDLAELQGAVDVVVSLAYAFPVIALIALGGYLWLSHNRRSGVVCAGLAIATSMVLLLVILAAFRWRYLDVVNTDVSRAAAAAFFDIIGRYLRAAIRLIALLGLVIAGVAFATRPGGVLAQFFQARRQMAGDRQGVQNPAVLAGGILAVTCLCLIAPDRITQDWWRATLLAAGLSLVVILMLSRSGHRLEAATPVEPGPNSHLLVPMPPPATDGNGRDEAGTEQSTALERGQSV